MQKGPKLFLHPLNVLPSYGSAYAHAKIISSYGEGQGPTMHYSIGHTWTWVAIARYTVRSRPHTYMAFSKKITNLPVFLANRGSRGQSAKGAPSTRLILKTRPITDFKAECAPYKSD